MRTDTAASIILTQWETLKPFGGSETLHLRNVGVLKLHPRQKSLHFLFFLCV